MKPLGLCDIQNIDRNCSSTRSWRNMWIYQRESNRSLGGTCGSIREEATEVLEEHVELSVRKQQKSWRNMWIYERESNRRIERTGL
jgi:hypothetical protein